MCCDRRECLPFRDRAGQPADSMMVVTTGKLHTAARFCKRFGPVKSDFDHAPWSSPTSIIVCKLSRSERNADTFPSLLLMHRTILKPCTWPCLGNCKTVSLPCTFLLWLPAWHYSWSFMVTIAHVTLPTHTWHCCRCALVMQPPQSTSFLHCLGLAATRQPRGLAADVCCPSAVI